MSVTEFEKPKIECVELSENYGKYVVEPLERGFGHTLGSTLRRVLLSSLPGAAVTSVFIKGMQHGVSTMNGIKEDMTEIIQNLKMLAVRLCSDGVKMIRIDKRGPCELKAVDLAVDSELEIINEDLHIATLDQDAHLLMTLTLDKNRGYVSAERNKIPNMPIDVIPMDSIFTPVSKVSYMVEDTRVGQMTDFDRLILEVWTDGTAQPDEAISMAAQILTNHLALIYGLTETQVMDFEETEDEKKEKASQTTVEELSLSVRAYNGLMRAGISTVSELVERSKKDMMNVRNLGKTSVEEIERKLHSFGLMLRADEE